MLRELSHRGRSLSPDFHLPRCEYNDGELDHNVVHLDHDDDNVPCRHVDSLIRQSRAQSMVTIKTYDKQ